jgi:FKBP-type peptidyl-prolyl cis-trans isomerase FklB
MGVGGALFAADPKPAAPAAPAQFKDNRDKTSYSLGVNIGTSMKMQGADINADEVASGLRDALAGTAKMSEQEVRETLMAWQQDLRGKRTEKLKVEGEKNKKAGEEWLAANAKKEGVKTTPSGLQYKVLVTGKGPQPKAEDTVSAHYKGTLTDGTEFDSSYTRGKPLTIPVRGVVAGWQEALTNMHVGDKWELYVPGNLAYGERGSPPKIGANATLVFEMELLGIEPPNTNAAPAFPSLNAGPGGAPQFRVPPGQGTPGGRPPVRVEPAPGNLPQLKLQSAPSASPQIKVEPVK